MPNSKSHYYLFIDESGNFDFSQKGTRFFVMTAILVRRPFPWNGQLTALRYDLMESGHVLKCFHASEDRQKIRDQVFGVISAHLDAIEIHSVIVDKPKTWPHLRLPTQFYPKIIMYLVRYIFEGRSFESPVTITTDSLPLKKHKRAIEKGIKVSLSQELPKGSTYQIMHHPSMSSEGLQVVDYCNWAIQRKWEGKGTTSYDIISPSIRSEFDIFRDGTIQYYEKK